METSANFWTRVSSRQWSTSTMSWRTSCRGMGVWEQAEIDKSTVETLDGTNNEWGWSRVSLFTFISKLAGKPTDKFVEAVQC